jgi:hypothetical protein
MLTATARLAGSGTLTCPAANAAGTSSGVKSIVRVAVNQERRGVKKLRKIARGDWFPGLFLLIFYIVATVILLVCFTPDLVQGENATPTPEPRPWLERYIENQR